LAGGNLLNVAAWLVMPHDVGKKKPDAINNHATTKEAEMRGVAGQEKSLAAPWQPLG